VSLLQLSGGPLMDDKNGYGAQLFFLIAALVILLGLSRV
jgi:hypothetical protein